MGGGEEWDWGWLGGRWVSMLKDSKFGCSRSVRWVGNPRRLQAQPTSPTSRYSREPRPRLCLVDFLRPPARRRVCPPGRRGLPCHWVSSAPGGWLLSTLSFKASSSFSSSVKLTTNPKPSLSAAAFVHLRRRRRRRSSLASEHVVNQWHAVCVGLS